MSVQVPSSLFTLKKTERLLQEQRLGGHWVPTPEGRAGGGGSGMFPRTGFREGTLAEARSPRFYSKVGFILDVGKCSRVFVVGEKGNCRVRPMWVIRGR